MGQGSACLTYSFPFRQQTQDSIEMACLADKVGICVVSVLVMIIGNTGGSEIYSLNEDV